MKVLIIGNKFTSQMCTYLPAMAKAGGKELMLSNLTAGNTSVESHYRNYTDENEVYTYETYLPSITEAMKPDGIALHEAVEDDDWDAVMLSQNIALGGIRESYNPYLAELAAYCRLMHPQAEIILIEPWSYGPGCKKKAFAEAYNSDSEEMYEKISVSCQAAAQTAEADRIIHIGRAFQTARKTQPGISLTTDGENADEAGRFLAACVIYRALFNESAFGNPFRLPALPDETDDLLRLVSEKI